MTRKLFRALTFSSILSLLFLLYTPLTKTEADQVPDYIDIDTFPQDIFIDMGGMKPGDKIITTINIQNKGTIDFTYFTYSEFLGGSLPYFNALKINISDESNHNLYSGLLHGLKNLDPRKLPIFKSEELTFVFEIPHELGNEYQGVTSSFNLVFSAEAPETKPPTCEEDPTQSGCEDPPSCEEDPTQSVCEDPPTCEEDPAQSGCGDPPSCEEDPTQSGCGDPPSCEEDPTQSGCEDPPSCEEDPTQSVCEDPPSCEEDPAQSGCGDPPSCEEDPAQSGCEDPPSCEEDPSQSGCEDPPSCEEDSSQSGCEDPPSCEEDQTQPDCEEPPVKVPANPEGPHDPSESGNGETEPEKSENDTIKDPINTSNLLPDTATNIYNLLLIGGLLFVSGAAILLIYIRKARREL